MGQHRDVTLNWAVAPGHEKTSPGCWSHSWTLPSANDTSANWKRVASISKVWRTVKTLKELLNRLLDESIELVKADSGSIWLYNPSTDLISLETKKNWSDETILSLQRGEGIPGLVIQKGEAINVREFRSDPNIAKKNRDVIPEGIGGACIPLHAAENVVGVMFINVRVPRELTMDEIQILNTLAEIGGNAIHRMRLLEQSMKQIDRLSSLRTIDLAISNSLDLRISLNTVLEQVTTQLEVDAVCQCPVDARGHEPPRIRRRKRFPHPGNYLHQSPHRGGIGRASRA
jgi:GAF domain-containing protein